MRAVIQFFKKLKKIFEYAVFLWNDFDWDYVFILKLLKYKLERTRKCLVKENIIADVDQVAHQIRVAELILERLIADDYCSKEYDEYFDKYPIKMNDPRRMTSPEQRADFKRIADREAYLINYDYDTLFRYLKRHIRGWWS